MNIKKKLLVVLVAICFLVPCVVEAVDIAECWNYTNLHTRYFKELSINPSEPWFVINWVQAQGYTQNRDGIDWYKYVWSFADDYAPDVRARTAYGHNSSYHLDGFDKYFYPPNRPAVLNKEQMFNPYRTLSGRFVSLFQEWGSYETMYKWMTNSWADWSLGDVIGPSSNLSGINDI